MRRCEPAWLNIACIAPSYQVRHRLSAYTLFDIDILAFPQMNTMNERSHQELMQAKLDSFLQHFMHSIENATQLIYMNFFSLIVCIRSPISD